MAETPKILAQTDLTTTGLTDVYTVPALTTAVCSTIALCNRSGSAVTVRVSLAVAGAADATKQYLYYDLSVDTGDTFASTTGITLGAGDVVRAKAATANAITVQVFGVEVS